MRYSKTLIKTLKEKPKEATLKSHEYLVRGSFVEQIGSGIYNFLPLGLKVYKNVENIIREEMDKAGAIELSLSYVTPASLWKESGRYQVYGKELLRFKDRKDYDFILSPTHEESMLNTASKFLKSYKQLPINLYQIGLKFRDEVRPRFGLLRCKEFVMKDAYSFHDNSNSLEKEFNNMRETYKKIFDRLDINYRVVEADSGSIGGNGSNEFMAIADSGEDDIVLCDSCDYAANIEIATKKIEKLQKDRYKDKFDEYIETKDLSTIKDISEFLKVEEKYIIKAVAKKIVFLDRKEIFIFFIAGNDSLEDTKCISAIEDAIDIEDVTKEELISLGIVVGNISPYCYKNSKIDKKNIIIDSLYKNATGIISGSDKEKYHKVIDIDDSFKFTDLASVKVGDNCPKCGNKLNITKGIELGHIFKLYDKYSKAMNKTYLDENAKTKNFLMGCYGIGVSRIIAAILEQKADNSGCIWGKTIAPFDIQIIVSNSKNSTQSNLGEELYEIFNKKYNVLLDDRKSERYGSKIKDFELIGSKYAIVIGKKLEENMSVELIDRSSLEKKDIAVQDIKAWEIK